MGGVEWAVRHPYMSCGRQYDFYYRKDMLSTVILDEMFKL